MCACVLTMVGCSKDDSNSPSGGSGSGTGSRGLSVELKNVAGGAWLLKSANGTKDGLSVSTQNVQQLKRITAPVLLAINSKDTTYTCYTPSWEGNVVPENYTEWTWTKQGFKGASGHGILNIVTGRIVLTDDVKLPATEPGGMEEDCVLALYVQELTETTMTCTYTLDNEQMACTYWRLGYNPAESSNNEGDNNDPIQPEPLEPTE